MYFCEVRDVGLNVPIALFPYVVYNRGPVRVASLPDFGLADQLAPVFTGDHMVSDGDFAPVWQSFIEVLRGVDLVDIHKVPPWIGDQPNPLYAASGSKASEEMLVLDVSPGSTGEWKKKSVFKEARAKGRKLSEQGVVFVQTQDGQDCLAIFEQLREQKRDRYDAVGRVNSLENSPGYAGFYRHLSANASPGGPVTAFCLRTGDEIVSAALAFTNQDAVNGVLISMGNDKWRRCSPGTVLLAKIVEWAEENGLNKVYFGTGMQEYKKRFGGDVIQLNRINQPLTAMGEGFLAARSMYKIVRLSIERAAQFVTN